MLTHTKKRRISSAVCMLKRKPVVAYMLPMKPQNSEGFYELERPTCSRTRQCATTSNSLIRTKTIVEVDPRTGGPFQSSENAECSTGSSSGRRDYRQKYCQPVWVLKQTRTKINLNYNLDKSIQTGMLATSNIPHRQDKSTSMPPQGVYSNTMVDEATSVKGLSLTLDKSTSISSLVVDVGTSYDEDDSEFTAERAMENLRYALDVYGVSLETFTRGLELVHKENAAKLMADELMIREQTANRASTESSVSSITQSTTPLIEIYYDAECEPTPKCYCDVGTETTTAKSYCDAGTETAPAKCYCDKVINGPPGKSYCDTSIETERDKSYSDAGTETTPAKCYCDKVINATPGKSYCDTSIETERDQCHCQCKCSANFEELKKSLGEIQAHIGQYTVSSMIELEPADSQLESLDSYEEHVITGMNPLTQI